MPPRYYTLVAHPEARLSDAEEQALIDGLAGTLREGGENGERDDG